MSSAARNESSWSQHASIADVLLYRAREQPEQICYRFLSDDGVAVDEISHRDLAESALKIGAWLQSRGIFDQPVPLIFPAGIDFIRAFFGCLCGGNLAVPLNLPSLSEGVERVLTVLAEVHPTVVLGADSALSRVARGYAKRSLGSDCELVALAGMRDADWRECRLERSAESLAFLQFTSGSTSSPKGVEITHANLLHNVGLMSAACRARSDSRGVSWLPHFHDMGLIGGILMPLFVGFPVTLMSPASFMRRPARWLEAISRIGATISGGPNFGYEHCLRSIGDLDLHGLDLSSWQTAFSGAEPIRAETISRFCARFQSVGFRKGSFFPCYGLAEATLMVSGQHWGEECEQSFDRRALEHGRAEAASAGEVRQLISSGSVCRECDVRIVDPQTMQVCADGCVGEVWVSGPSVGRGYWRRPQESASTFHACAVGLEREFLRTGDLGFLFQGQLFIVGRQKELLIIRGRNFYPQDIETALEEAVPALRKGVGAALSVEHEQDEALLVVYELDTPLAFGLEALFASVRSVLAEAFGLQAQAILLVARNQIPRTTSGKIKRQQCKADVLGGRLSIIAEWRSEPVEDVMSAGGLDSQDLKFQMSVADVGGIVKGHLAELLEIDVDAIDASASIYELGVDSLIAARLQNRIEQSLDVRLDLVKLLEAATLERLIWELVRQMTDQQRTPGDVMSILERVAKLSDDEVACLLAVAEGRECGESL